MMRAYLPWALVIGLLSTSAAFAQKTTLANLPLQPIVLQGEHKYDVWNTLKRGIIPDAGDFPGTTMWAPYDSQIVSPGYSRAQLHKLENGVGGGAFGSGSSLYIGGGNQDPNVYGGKLAVVDSNPLADLKTVAFQIEIGEAFGYDLYNDAMPQLTIVHSGGTHTFDAATLSFLLGAVPNGTFPAPEVGPQPLYVNLYGLQWDVSAYTNISSISISFDPVMHSSTYGLQLDQSTHHYGTESVFTVVPEPAAYALALVGVVVLAAVVRRRRA